MTLDPLNLTLQASATGATGFAWTFSDGTIAVGDTLTRPALAPGTYSGKVVAQDASGAQVEQKFSLTLQPPAPVVVTPPPPGPAAGVWQKVGIAALSGRPYLNPLTNDLYLIGPNIISGDGGRYWPALPDAPGNLNGIGFNAKGELVAGVGGQPGLLYLLRGGAWIRGKGATTGFTFTDIACSQSGRLVAVSSFGGEIWTSDDDGLSWAKGHQSLVGGLWCVDYNAALNAFFTGGETDGLFRSPDGRSWHNVGMQKAAGYGGNIFATIANGQGEQMAGRSYKAAVFQFHVLGPSGWVAGKGLPPYQNVYSADVDRTTGDCYVGLANNHVFRSSDHGRTWLPFSQGLTLTTQSSGGAPRARVLVDSTRRLAFVMIQDQGLFVRGI